MTWITRPCPKPPKSVKRARVSQPRKGLQHGKPMKRTRMKCGAGSKRRQGRMFAGRRDNAFMAWLHTLPCAICKILGAYQTTPTEVEHFVLRSQGGYDRGDTYPTCGTHREMRHGTMGPKAFTRMLKLRGFDERKLCKKLVTLYESERWPCP